VLLERRRFLPTAFLVFVLAFLFGFGRLLTDPLSPQRRPGEGGKAARSGEDAGFSIILASPREPYLLGHQMIVIEPTIPHGDSIAQVDIFVDGKLLFTDRQPPYMAETDFGDAIHRHTIVATALTRGGRRARVSFVSRNADLSETAPRPVEVLPAIVRDANGRPVDGLSVSDFTLLENGARQRIVHFDNQPAPLSIGILVDPAEGGAEAREPLLRGIAGFAGPLPGYQALALYDAWLPADPAPYFSYNREPFLERMQRARAAQAPPHADGLPALLSAAAQGLSARPGVRVLFLLLGAPPPPPPPPALEPGADGAVEPGAGDAAAEAPKEGAVAAVAAAAKPQAAPQGKKTADGKKAPAPETELGAALEALRRARVTLHLLVLGEPGEGPPYADLEKAAAESGGDFLVATPQEIDARCRALSDALLHEYLISFVPESPDRAGWRPIEVRVGRADLQVLAPKGYSTN
jgi:hypothetical protein